MLTSYLCRCCCKNNFNKNDENLDTEKQPSVSYVRENQVVLTQPGAINDKKNNVFKTAQNKNLKSYSNNLDNSFSEFDEIDLNHQTSENYNFNNSLENSDINNEQNNLNAKEIDNETTKNNFETKKQSNINERNNKNKSLALPWKKNNNLIKEKDNNSIKSNLTENEINEKEVLKLDTNVVEVASTEDVLNFELMNCSKINKQTVTNCNVSPQKNETEIINQVNKNALKNESIKHNIDIKEITSEDNFQNKSRKNSKDSLFHKTTKNNNLEENLQQNNSELLQEDLSNLEFKKNFAENDQKIDKKNDLLSQTNMLKNNVSSDEFLSKNDSKIKKENTLNLKLNENAKNEIEKLKETDDIDVQTEKEVNKKNSSIEDLSEKDLKLSKTKFLISKLDKNSKDEVEKTEENSDLICQANNLNNDKNSSEDLSKENIKTVLENLLNSKNNTQSLNKPNTL